MSPSYHAREPESGRPPAPRGAVRQHGGLDESPERPCPPLRTLTRPRTQRGRRGLTEREMQEYVRRTVEQRSWEATACY